MTDALKIDPLFSGREAFRAKRWSEAVELLSKAEDRSPLTTEDYEAPTVARFLISPDSLDILSDDVAGVCDNAGVTRAVFCGTAWRWLSGWPSDIFDSSLSGKTLSCSN
jgi:hypothetical protein